MVAGIPFKIEGVEEIQWDQLLSQHVLSAGFISSNFCPVFICEEEGKKEKCSFKVHVCCSEGLVCCRIEKEQSKAGLVSCDTSVQG